MDLIIKAIQQLLKDIVNQEGSNLKDIKKVYYGDPILIAAQNFPAITIQPVNTEYIQRGSRYDNKKHSIDIKLIYNTKSYFSENPNIEKVTAVEDSIKKIEESLNFETINDSICGVIQKNPQLFYNGLPTCTLSKVQNVNYSFSEGRGFPTYEVSVSIIVDVVGDR